MRSYCCIVSFKYFNKALISESAAWGRGEFASNKLSISGTQGSISLQMSGGMCYGIEQTTAHLVVPRYHMSFKARLVNLMMLERLVITSLDIHTFSISYITSTSVVEKNSVGLPSLGQMTLALSIRFNIRDCQIHSLHVLKEEIKIQPLKRQKQMRLSCMIH